MAIMEIARMRTFIKRLCMDMLSVRPIGYTEGVQMALKAVGYDPEWVDTTLRNALLEEMKVCSLDTVTFSASPEYLSGQTDDSTGSRLQPTGAVVRIGYGKLKGAQMNKNTFVLPLDMALALYPTLKEYEFLQALDTEQYLAILEVNLKNGCIINCSIQHKDIYNMK